MNPGLSVVEIFPVLTWLPAPTTFNGGIALIHTHHPLLERNVVGPWLGPIFCHEFVENRL
jgi:hypothetical protein